MSNVIRNLRLSIVATMLWAVCGATAHGAASSDPTYTYKLDLSRNKTLCSHMLRVFNRNFSDFWVGARGGLALDSESDGMYSAQSPFAWPTLPGVEHNYRMTFDMRYSKVPSSAEFDAIGWREGHVSLGAVELTPPKPVLFANIDIDNDGAIDTVMRAGFSNGYAYMISRPDPEPESIGVWRSVQLNVAKVRALSELNVRQIGGAVGGRLRPFTIGGRNYVAAYYMDLGGDFRSAFRPPYRPVKETMEVQSYRFTGEINKVTKAPQWTIDTLCRYSMQQRMTTIK